MSAPPGFVQLTQQEYDKLIERAITIGSTSRPAPPPGGENVRRTVRRTVEVPVTETVEVPVTRQVKDARTEKRTVRSTKMVPVTKSKFVEQCVAFASLACKPAMLCHVSAHAAAAHSTR